MSRYSVIFKKADGFCFNGLCYNSEHTPPASAVPADCELVFFDENNADYDKLYALFIEDELHVMKDYSLPVSNGVKYDFNSKTYEFFLRPAIDILVQVREFRNKLITQSDLIMQVPDLPASIKEEIIAYRQALRDITKDADPSWVDVGDFPWPPIPSALAN